MDMVLRGLTWDFVLVYIDDIVVYAHTYEELKTRLEEVFIRLRGANLKLKPTKVKLFQREIQFLGHRISRDGVAMDPAKISEIVSWHHPKNVHDVRQFLGLCGYYRRFVKDYAQVAAPLHELTRIAEPFLWTEARDAAYENLKTNLVTAPILAMSLDVGTYKLDVDASRAVLLYSLEPYCSRSKMGSCVSSDTRRKRSREPNSVTVSPVRSWRP